MKYVMFRKPGKTFNMYLPIIFPVACAHISIAEAMTGHKDFAGYMPVSAGTLSIMPSDLLVGGDSPSLQMRSELPRDASIIGMCDYGAANAWD